VEQWVVQGAVVLLEETGQSVSHVGGVCRQFWIVSVNLSLGQEVQYLSRLVQEKVEVANFLAEDVLAILTLEEAGDWRELLGNHVLQALLHLLAITELGQRLIERLAIVRDHLQLYFIILRLLEELGFVGLRDHLKDLDRVA